MLGASERAVSPARKNWGAHEPFLMGPDASGPGNGLLLFFRVGDFDEALRRARAFAAT